VGEGWNGATEFYIGRGVCRCAHSFLQTLETFHVFRLKLVPTTCTYTVHCTYNVYLHRTLYLQRVPTLYIVPTLEDTIASYRCSLLLSETITFQTRQIEKHQWLMPLNFRSWNAVWQDSRETYEVKYSIYCTDFHEIQSYLTAFCLDIQRHHLRKFVKKCGFFFSCGATAQRGPWPPHSRGF